MVGKPSRIIDPKISGKKIPYVRTVKTGITVATQIFRLKEIHAWFGNIEINLNTNFNRQKLSILTQVVIFFLLISTVWRDLLKKGHQICWEHYFAEENNRAFAKVQRTLFRKINKYKKGLLLEMSSGKNLQTTGGKTTSEKN